MNSSDEDFSRFFESSVACLHLVGPQGTILRANRAELELLGYAAEEYIGRNIAEFHAERAVVEDVLARLTRGETLRNHPARLRCKDGAIKDVLIDSNVRRGARGEFIHTRCFTRDVTAQRRAEAALAEQKALLERQRRLYEAILANTPDLAYIFGLDHRFIYANEVLLKMWGKTWEEAIGRNCQELGYEPWHAELHDREIEQVIATGQPVRGEVPFTGTSGRRVYDYIFVPVLDAQGNVEAVAGTTRDITGHKQAEDALKDAGRRKDEFMAMFAHELRNPLAAITLSAELLARARLQEKRAQFAVPAIARQAKHLQRLADDLLDMARATYGELELQKEPLDLLAAAQASVADHRTRALKVSFEIEGEQVWVDGDGSRVRQMLSNLVDNALKYGGRKIAIRVAREGAWARVSVSDDGQGVERDLLLSIFEPFVQGSRALDRAHGGLGLGLALVERLARLHGGGLEARSAGAGKGSTFTISLPATGAPARPRRKAAAGAALRKRRILIIEDEADSRESLRLLLEADGHEVSFAGNGAEGLARVSAFKPHYALIDIGLPGMDGFELARRLRALPEGRRVKLIALTGYGESKDREKSGAAGFDLHFTKPIAYEELRRAFGS